MAGGEQCSGLEIPFRAEDQVKWLFTAREELQGPKLGDLLPACAYQSSGDTSQGCVTNSNWDREMLRYGR